VHRNQAFLLAKPQLAPDEGLNADLVTSAVNLAQFEGYALSAVVRRRITLQMLRKLLCKLLYVISLTSCFQTWKM
jgi:hypothetical protein